MKISAASFFVFAVVCQTTLLAPSAFGQSFSTFVRLHQFPSTDLDANVPSAALTLGRDGLLYGTSYYGGPGYSQGTVFSMTNEGVVTVLHSFDYAGAFEGVYPTAELTQGSDGRFYGTAAGGGTPTDENANAGDGAVFAITSAGELTTLHRFNHQADGQGRSPYAGLVQGRDGKFYGTTALGGTYNDGTIFSITSGGALTTLHSFNYNGDGGEGLIPTATLVQGPDGKFYGTTTSGGMPNRGTVFSITPEGVFATVHVFTGENGDGASPESGLIVGRDGKLYGTTEAGGTEGDGTVYTITTDGTYTTLHSFSRSLLGVYSPYAKLVQASDGRFYGTTTMGGNNGYAGAVYSITSGGFFNVIHGFDQDNEGFGSRKGGGLVQGSDGFLYGTTEDNAVKGGIAYKIALDPTPPVVVPTVTLSAVTPSVTVGGGQVGKLVLTLSAPAAADVQVAYAVKGSARAGVDYAALSGAAKIKAGKTSKVIKIKPQGSLGGAKKKVVKMTLVPGDGYAVGTGEQVKLKILAAP